MTDGKDKKTRRRSKSRRGRGKRDQQRSCGRKRRYATKQAAVDAALALRRKTTMRLVAYRCTHCKVKGEDGQMHASWHIGNKTPLRRRLGG